MRWINCLFVGIGVLFVVGCEDHNELDAPQKRIEELKLREEKVNVELEGVIQQVNDVKEASRAADEDLQKQKKELMSEFRVRLAAFEIKSVKVANGERNLELRMPQIADLDIAYEKRLRKIDWIVDSLEIHDHFDYDVDPEPFVRELNEKFEKLILREKKLKEEIARIRAKVGE